MEQSVMQTPKNKTKRSLVFFIIALVLLGLVLYIAQSRGNFLSQQISTPSQQTAPTTDPNLWMKLQSATGSMQFSQSEEVTVLASASSSSRNIAGYDMLISYDPSFFDVVNVKSVDPNFVVNAFKKAGMISITGTKSTSFSGQIFLDNTNLVNVVLRPKKKGTTTVSIQAATGPERTRLVDTEDQKLTPQLTAVTLTIN